MCAHDQRSCFLLACLASLHACLLAASNGSGNTMNSKSLEQAKNLVKSSYISQGDQALNGRKKVVTALFSNRRLPARGWDDAQIEYLLTELSLMDSNNFTENVGVGEREGRVYSGMVARRNYRLSHGVGRSGDIAEVQPKAAGSSLLAKLTHALARDALRLAGLGNASTCLVLPLATGMSLSLTFSALRASRPAAKAIVWPRMDQKSCLKAIVAAGFTPIVVENLIEGDAVVTDVKGVRAAVEACGADNVLCVVTTTSCFAPRLPDKVDEVARICAQTGVGHVINNAYGVQCSRTCRLVNRAMTVGRVDAIVQSTDKNFMVPVGGAVVCGPDPAFIEQVGKSYAGRASSGPCLDLFITLLSMGEEGWRRLLTDRETLVDTFRDRLGEVATSNGERLLESGGNTISFAITLDTLAHEHTSSAGAKQDAHGNNNGGTRPATAPASAFLGSMLFTRCVSGTRVVPRGQLKSVGGIDFAGYGASVNGYPHDYLTAACAVGLSSAELDEFLLRLDKALRKAKGGKDSAGSENPAAAELRDDAAEEGVAAVAVIENGLAKAEASGSGVGAAAAAEHHAAQYTPDGVVAAVTTAENHSAQATPGVVVATAAEHHAEKNTPDVVVAATAAEQHAQKNTPDVVVAATAAEHHAARAAQDTPGVEQRRVVQDTTDSDRFGGVSDTGVNGDGMPGCSEVLGLVDDDYWDGVD